MDFFNRDNYTLEVYYNLTRRLHHLILARRLHHRQPITLDFSNRDNYTLEVYYNPVISPVWIFILLAFLQSLQSLHLDHCAHNSVYRAYKYSLLSVFQLSSAIPNM